MEGEELIAEIATLQQRLQGGQAGSVRPNGPKRRLGEVLGLPVAYEDEEPCGYLLGETILLLKPDWYASPSAEPSPRITLLVDDARGTERSLMERGVVIADEVESDGHGYVASFLDSEGNKIWFCSYA